MADNSAMTADGPTLATQSPAMPSSLSSPPLQRPTLRVQDGDIILEDAGVSPELHSPLPASSAGAIAATPPPPPRPSPGIISGGISPIRQSSQLTFNSLAPQLSRHDISRHPLTPDPSRTPTNGGIGSFRLHFEAVEVNNAQKLRTTELTSSNVQQLTKQTAGESGRLGTNERMWRWLADAGPPYEVQPSIGVASGRPTAASATHSMHKSQSGTGASRLFSCFSCFSRG